MVGILQDETDPMVSVMKACPVACPSTCRLRGIAVCVHVVLLGLRAMPTRLHRVQDTQVHAAWLD